MEYLFRLRQLLETKSSSEWNLVDVWCEQEQLVGNFGDDNANNSMWRRYTQAIANV